MHFTFVRVSILLVLATIYSPLYAQIVDKVECPQTAQKPPEVLRSDVYKGLPYRSGERSEYEISYMGTVAGTAFLEVRPPMRHNGAWHRVFHAEAKTGTWFESIFIGYYVVDAIIRPWDSAAARFYLEQNEGKIFSRPTHQKKWLEFDHVACKTREKTQKKDKPEELAEFDLSFGAKDIIGAIQYLRTFDYKVGEKIRLMVYTSEKNWWLEAHPLAIEQIKTKAGSFDAMKMKLQTFVGKDLQQRGDVFVWYALSGAKPLLQAHAEIKVGSMKMILTGYQSGS